MKRRTIIDMHAHIYPEKIVEKAVESICKFYDMPMHNTGYTQELLRNARENNVKKILVHSTATKPEQVESINNYIISETQKYEEFIGFGTLHPEYLNITVEVERMTAMGLRGVKLHPDFQRFNLDDENAYAIYEACSDKLPILFHTGDYRQDYSNPARLARVMKRFPNLKVIAAHFGGWSVWDYAYEVLEPSHNLYFDTASSLYHINKEFVHKFIEKFGADKLLFGTDYPMWKAIDEIERVEALCLGEEVEERIFHRNAEEFLGLVTKYS